MKPLAFAADAEGYKYIVWVFNSRFAISSPQPCENCGVSLKQNCLAHRHNTTWTKKKPLHPSKTAALEHALASAAQRLRPNLYCAHRVLRRPTFRR